MRADQTRTPMGSRLRMTPSVVRANLVVVAVSVLFLLLSTVSGGTAQATANATGINVALVPQAGSTVALGGDLYLDFKVTQPSAGFNTWEGTLCFDHNALTYIAPSPPALQEGCLMTGSGGCTTQSCGSTYLTQRPGPDSLYILDGILCYQTQVTSAGTLFTLHFKASNTAQQTSVYFRNLRFLSGPNIVSPMTLSNASIGIGMPAAAVGPSGAAKGLHLRATPNPSRGAVTLAMQSEHSGDQELVVHDVLGRTVRVISRGWQPAGARQLVWDGRDESGGRVAPGVYMVTLRVANHRTLSPVTLLQ